MAFRTSVKRSFFPWERRGGLLRRSGLRRLRPLVGIGAALALLIVIAMRERHRSGVRKTRAILLDVRDAVDAYLADHNGRCPARFELLADYGSFEGVPVDAWGNPLTLICPGGHGESYRLVSAGADGIAGGLDRIE